MKKENKKQWWLLFVSIALIVFGVNYMDGHFDEKNFKDFFRISYLTLAWLIIPLFLSFLIAAITRDKVTILTSFIALNILIILTLIGLYSHQYYRIYAFNHSSYNHSFFNDEDVFYSDEEKQVCRKVVDLLEDQYKKDSIVIISSSIKIFKDSTALINRPNLRYRMFSIFRINNEYHEPLSYFDLIELDEKQRSIFHMTKRVAWKYLKLIDSLQYNGKYFEAIKDTAIANQLKRNLNLH